MSQHTARRHSYALKGFKVQNPPCSTLDNRLLCFFGPASNHQYRPSSWIGSRTLLPRRGLFLSPIGSNIRKLTVVCPPLFADPCCPFVEAFAGSKTKGILNPLFY